MHVSRTASKSCETCFSVLPLLVLPRLDFCKKKKKAIRMAGQAAIVVTTFAVILSLKYLVVVAVPYKSAALSSQPATTQTPLFYFFKSM